MAVRKAYQGAVDMVGEMPDSVEYSPHPDFCELTRHDYRRMGTKWERWAKKLARITGQLLTELDGRDEEARERWINRTLEETSIKAMEFRAGMSMELEPAREMVAHWVGCARGMLGDAPNYSETPIEMVVKVAESPESFAFILQRVGKLTPHQARQRAEAERDKALAALQAVREAQSLGEALAAVAKHDGLTRDLAAEKKLATVPGVEACYSGRHCVTWGFCRRCAPELAGEASRLFKATGGSSEAYAAIVKGLTEPTTEEAP